MTAATSVSLKPCARSSPNRRTAVLATPRDDSEAGYIRVVPENPFRRRGFSACINRSFAALMPLALSTIQGPDHASTSVH